MNEHEIWLAVLASGEDGGALAGPLVQAVVVGDGDQGAIAGKLTANALSSPCPFLLFFFFGGGGGNGRVMCHAPYRPKAPCVRLHQGSPLGLFARWT